MSDFKRKFRNKTSNQWDKRSKFQAVYGKYTLLEMAEDGEDDTDSVEPVIFSTKF